jgi:hypothetical protein
MIHYPVPCKESVPCSGLHSQSDPLMTSDCIFSPSFIQTLFQCSDLSCELFLACAPKLTIDKRVDLILTNESMKYSLANQENIPQTIHRANATNSTQIPEPQTGNYFPLSYLAWLGHCKSTRACFNSILYILCCPVTLVICCWTYLAHLHVYKCIFIGLSGELPKALIGLTDDLELLALYIVIMSFNSSTQHVLFFQVVVLFSMLGCGSWSQLTCTKPPI